MRGLIDGLLFVLTVLFIVRLYVTHEQFAGLVNRMFAGIEGFYQKLKSQYSKSRKQLIMAVGLISLVIILLMLIASYSLFLGIALAILLLVPVIPLWLESMNNQKRADFNGLTEAIRNGELSKAQIAEIKQALKEYYASKYQPKLPSKDKPSLIIKIATGAILLVFPKSWPRLIIPRLTALPLFSGFFHHSLFHARFNHYKKIIDSVYPKIDIHPYRLTAKEIFIDEMFMTFEFRDDHKHALSRLQALARRLEQEHRMDKEAIMVQQNEGLVKLLIPAESLTSS